MHATVLVDDHKIMRDGLRAILRGSGDFEVVGEAETGADAILLVRRHRPAIVVMDLQLPGLSGIEATREILRFAPETRIVVLSMYEDEASVVGAIQAGARAFVLKTASDSDLLDALRAVVGGGSYLSPRVSDKLLARIQKGEVGQTRAPGPLDALTPRELQVMRLVAEGKSSKEVAVLLDLGHQTVRGYRKTLMKKLGVSNVAGLTQMALAEGLLGAAPGSPARAAGAGRH
jgi:DNA-binding NarL/FixJ family response regulator